MSIVKLGKLSNIEALVALFNNAIPLGLGKLQYNPLHKLSELEANSALLQSDYVDYLEGRVIKTRFPLKATEIDCTLYDRDNGEGSAERAIREYERVHYLERGNESLYIPESFGGSVCNIVKDEGYGNVYKFHVMGGELLVFRFRDFHSGFIKTVFKFVIEGKSAVQYLDGGVRIDYCNFVKYARLVINKYVDILK